MPFYTIGRLRNIVCKHGHKFVLPYAETQISLIEKDILDGSVDSIS